MKTDVQIAQEATLKPILDIAQSLQLTEEQVECYGKTKAKILLQKDADASQKGKLILVTAINPTAAGEGKTTTSIGLADSLSALGKKAVLALREPSLGPVFGMKGGATGGGYAQVLPMEDINLHFTGDFNAIALANNLLVALLDNHLHHGNELNIDPRTIAIKRVVDMNDRQLRFLVSGLHGKVNGVPREDAFEIVVASEVMAILCLAKDLSDLKTRLGNIVVAYTYEGEVVRAKDLKAEGSMCVLLKDAIKPNLVQTLEHTPAFVHGGPFANIAHGCNSVLATRLALNLGEYVVTEAGFGADLGAEKFLDIKCRLSGLSPDVVVLVATVRALKLHGGASSKLLAEEDLQALSQGLPHLLRHIENIKEVFGLPCVVALNEFPTDTEAEIALVKRECAELGVSVVISQVWAKGSQGGEEMAKAVIALAEQEQKPQLRFAYDLEDALADKIEKVVKKVYRGRGIKLSATALRKIKQYESMGYGQLPICIAKTQYSFSDDKSLIGTPSDFVVQVKDVKLAAGAGFVVVYCGDIMTMPGLPKVPAAHQIDIDAEGKITGLF